MKISKAQKKENEKALLFAAVDLMTKQGFKKTTMTQIAKAAKLSDPVVYKYFPTKESILFGYFKHHLEETINSLLSNNDFEQYSLHEQLHALIETQIDAFKPHKAFVKMAFKTIFVTSLSNSQTDTRESKEIYIRFITELLNAAISVKEIEEPPIKNFVTEMLWDGHVGVIYYWLNDDSDNSMKTTEMIDKSLALLIELLRSNILAKSLDLFYFIIRQHLINKVGHFGGLSDWQKTAKGDFFKNITKTMSKDL